MYAIVRTGGKQYKVEEGQKIVVEKIEAEPGQEVVLEEVLMVSREEERIFGKPLVEGAKVIARVVEQKKGEKIIVFKKKPKKGYKKKIGHRQLLTVLQIEKIEV